MVSGNVCLVSNSRVDLLASGGETERWLGLVRSIGRQKENLTIFSLFSQVCLDFLQKIGRYVFFVHRCVQIQNFHYLRRGELIAHFDYCGNIVLALFGLQQFGGLGDWI